MKISKLLTCLLMLLMSSSVFSQGWERLYGSNSKNESFSNVALSPDGGLILAGVVDGLPPERYPFVYRTDAEGNILWSYTDSSAASNVVIMSDLLSTSDGSILFSYASSSVNFLDSFSLDKLSPQGDPMWSVVLPKDIIRWPKDLIELANGDILLIGEKTPPQSNKDGALAKYDADGNLLWNYHLLAPNGLPLHLTSGIETSNGDFLVVGYMGYPYADINVILTKFNASGEILWQKIYTQPNHQYAHDIIEIQPNEYAISTSVLDTTGLSEAAVLSVNENGDELWWKTVPGYGSSSILVATSYGCALIGEIGTKYVDRNFLLTRLDQNGVVLGSKTHGRDGDNVLGNFVRDSDDNLFIAGADNQTNHYDCYLIKTDSLGYSFTNQLSGKVFFDEDTDCLQSNIFTDLENWLVKIEKDSFEWFTTTDQNGNYFFDLDTGIYQVTTFPVSPYWNLCEDTTTVNFTNFFDTDTIDFAAQANINCPFLDVSVSTPFLRRCFENTYYVDFCNQGTDIATNAYIELTLDPEMTYLSSSLPFSTQNGLTYTFEIGNVDVGVCDQFTVDVQLGCDSVLLGQTHCVEAHIYPDTFCLPPPPNWSGASIEVDGTCEGDSIIFFIQNIGTAPTQGAIEYIVIEDDVILMRANDVFGVNETRRLAIATTGKTYRLEADQEPGHPGLSAPSVSIERCIAGSGGTVSLGYITRFPQNDGNAYIDIDCQENIGAYDPNDKRAYPKGATVEHIINQNETIEYLIRFQNTGTDTAFNVVIKDTLSEWLDPTSIRVGASSHPFTYTLTSTNVLQFRFADIMLPDSNINEPASHGFVRFQIAQQPDLPYGTVILNDADIYFDFNAPIVTNETFHMIGELRLIVDVEEVQKEGVEVKVFPNPFNQQSTMKIIGLDDLKQAQLVIYSSTGQKIRHQAFTGNQLSLRRGNLPVGIYFFQLTADGQLIGNGKLMVQ